MKTLEQRLKMVAKMILFLTLCARSAEVKTITTKKWRLAHHFVLLYTTDSKLIYIIFNLIWIIFLSCEPAQKTFLYIEQPFVDHTQNRCS